jgi:hypothetical protein
MSVMPLAFTNQQVSEITALAQPLPPYLRAPRGPRGGMKCLSRVRAAKCWCWYGQAHIS